ncbi:MAG: excinuclease ABC subunit UvrC, partial [Lachnospiraceae bacterium]|nr:excinuclease ABC subunit UvrC [Lachnospiraceae bacterium]
IKEHRPKYNTLLKDDKTYPYIKVTVQEDYPRILVARQMKKDKARYFGPYTSAVAVRDIIELLNRTYGLRDCHRVLPRDIGKERPCLNYHMGRCSAPCANLISKEEYREAVEKALAFLSGKYTDTVRDLTRRMEEAAEDMRFEEAASYRDLLNSVKKLSEKQKMSEGIGENKDVLGIAIETEETEGVETVREGDASGVVQTFFIRDGKLIGREHYYMTHIGGRTKAEVLRDFVQQFYGGTPFVPRQIMLPEAIEEKEILETWLSERRGGKVEILVPQKGKKEKLVELASENAALILGKDKERLKREEGRTLGAVREIAELLGLQGLQRMEAYDISNTSGFANVGSMVVYEKGRPKRSDYRKFRIRTVAGPDDYACMEEVLTRRFQHGLSEQAGEKEETGFARFPDLILMDGGKGQVNIALSVLQKLGISLPVCGMVKDDAHRTRGLYYNNKEIPIDTRSEGFKLITRIQDEVHRFAITYHRSLRSKAQTASQLLEIPGIGEARKKALMRRFSSIREIMEADVDTLLSVPELSKKEAQAVYDFFHPQA